MWRPRQALAAIVVVALWTGGEMANAEANRPPSLAGLNQQLAAENLPAGAVFDGEILKWTPTAHQAGRYAISITASDGQRRVGQELILIVVQTPYTFTGFLPPLGNEAPL